MKPVNIMKKAIIPILMTAMALLSVTACNFSDKTFEAIVKAANENCPENMGNGMVMTSIDFDGQSVVYNIECDENYYELSQDLATPEVKEALLDELLTSEKSDRNVRLFLSVLRKNQKGLSYHYYVPGTGMAMDVKFQPGEF